MKGSSREKDKQAQVETHECANCCYVGSHNACARCKVVHYCSKACQVQHWKAIGGHKMFCIPKEDRKPQGADFYKREVNERESSRECAVCLENLTPKTTCLLPCSHTFHIKCVEGLRAFGVAQTCPICRAQLPLGPEKLFEEATRRFLDLKCMVERMKLNFESLSKYQQIELSTITDLLRIAADQGHIGASRNLGIILEAKGILQSRYSP